MQDLEKLDAGDAAEAVAAGCDLAPLEEDVDIVPVTEGAGDLRMGLWIDVAEAIHCLVRENNAPSERVSRAIALDDRDAPRRIGFLHQD